MKRKGKPATVEGTMPSATQDQLMYDDFVMRDGDHKFSVVKKIWWLPRFKWNIQIVLDDKLEGYPDL